MAEGFGFWSHYIVSLSARYFIIAGIAFSLYYFVIRRWVTHKKIQARYPRLKDYAREITYSLITILIFATIATTLFHSSITKYTLVYTQFSDYPLYYTPLSFVILIFFHDAYFYWTHRIMHHRKLFKILHLVHHKSHNPSPWAALSFNPLEAILEAGVIIIAVFIIPFHSLVILGFIIFMLIYNVYGHLGYEIYPRGFNKHWFGKWLNTSVNHNLHHKYHTGNYGLYFTIWDRLMGTTHEKYHEMFEEVTSRPPETVDSNVRNHVSLSQ